MASKVGQGVDHTGMHQISSHGWCNEAGLELMRKTRPATQREMNECFWGTWQCPFAHNCAHGPKNHSLLAMIGYSFYKQVYVPVGQMSLFEPAVTHQLGWQNIRNGRIVIADERPMRGWQIVCKQYALAIVEINKRIEDPQPVVWRVRALRKNDRKWGIKMARKFAGRYPVCMFTDNPNV